MSEATSDYMNNPYADRRTEAVGDYGEFWFWGESKSPASLRRLKFAGYQETKFAWPLAGVEFDLPVVYEGTEYPIVLVGAGDYPNTVRRIYRWPLHVTLSVLLDEAGLSPYPVNPEDMAVVGWGWLEPTSFDEAPHYSGIIPGGLGEDLVKVERIGLHTTLLMQSRVEAPPGFWWTRMD